MRVAAVAYLAAHSTERKDILLKTLVDIVDSDVELSAVLEPEIKRAGKMLGFEVRNLNPVFLAPGNEENH